MKKALKKKIEKRKRSSKLWLYLTAVVCSVIVCTLVLVCAVCLLVFEFDVFAIDIKSIDTKDTLLIFLGGCLIIGAAITAFLGRLIIRHIQSISNAFVELSSGNFDVRVNTNQRLDEIREMSLRFNSMAKELSKIETLRKDFVVNVSHEFKTPLSAISGYATLLQNSNLPKEKHDRYVDIILQNSTRLSELSSNILAISKLENQDSIPMEDTFRLDEQIRTQILLLEGKWTKKNIGFEIDLPKLIYRGNEGLLAQVWSNLIDNAIKHSHENGVITITMVEADGTVTISVKDCGEGMSDDIIGSIFEKFYQGDDSRKSEGNGLGLPLAKKIVKLSGGKISVESQKGNGATFIVTLPRK